MIKNNLLEQDYHFQDKEPRESVIAIIWAAFAVSITTAAVLFFFLNYDEFNVLVMDEAMTGVMMIVMVFAYLLLKFFTTLFFCYDKGSIKLKLLESKYMP